MRYMVDKSLSRKRIVVFFFSCGLSCMTLAGTAVPDAISPVAVRNVRLSGRAGESADACIRARAYSGWARWIKPTDPEILLTEFADEEDTLTYFRTPDPDSPLLVDDELFGKARRCH